MKEYNKMLKAHLETENKIKMAEYCYKTGIVWVYNFEIRKPKMMNLLFKKYIK